MKMVIVVGIAVVIVVVVIAGVLGVETEEPRQPVPQTPQQPQQQSQSQREEIAPIKSDPEIKLPSEKTKTPQIESSSHEQSEAYPSAQCYDNAGCYKGHITKIIDGDTIEIDSSSVRLVLVDTPEYGEYGYIQAGNYIKELCPVGSPVLIDVDDWQVEDIYGRMLAVVYCDIWNLNEEILKSGWAEVFEKYCSESEFGKHSWVKRFGCEESYQYPVPQVESQDIQERCDSSYPDFCIVPPPPDLDCRDISQKNFTVLQPDPHRFDGDKDGIGCES